MQVARLLLPMFSAVATAQSLPTTFDTVTTTVINVSTTTVDPPGFTTTSGFELYTITIPDSIPEPSATGDPEHDPNGIRIPDNCSGRTMPDDGFASINAAIGFMEGYCKDMTEVNAIKARHGLMWRAENAQVYFCNYTDKPLGTLLLCSKTVYDQAEPIINDRCSPGGGGWVKFGESGGLEYSVGRDPRYADDGSEIMECGF